MATVIEENKKTKAREEDRKEQKPESEFGEKVLDIRRVTRVVAGGKRFSFSTVVVVGDRKGRVGVGLGKGLDVQDSIRKAKADAMANIITVPLKDGRTVPYDVDAKYGAARVRIKPTSKGHGLIAGGAVRVVLELVGIKDISAKILGGTGNKLNNAMAAIMALKKFN